MKRILVIAQHEFLKGIGQKAYFFSVMAFPLMILALGAIRSFDAAQFVLYRSQAIGVIDRAGVIDFSIAEGVQARETPSEQGGPAGPPEWLIMPYEDIDTGLEDLQSGKVEALYVVGSDYRTSGRVETYARDELGPQESKAAGLAVLENLIRASMLKTRVADETVNRVLSPTDLTRLVVTEEGTIISERSQRERLIAWMAPVSLGTLLAVWIMISSRYLVVATQEEGANRVMEVILSSVRPEQLLWGKLIGLSGVSFLHLTAFFVIVGLVRSAFWTFLNLPVRTLAVCLVFCMAGYLFYAGLMTAAGMTGLSRAATFITLSAWIPIMMVGPLSGDPNGTLAQVLSIIPLTSTMTMVLRLGLATVPITDVIISLAVLIVSAYLTVYVGAKAFRVGTLMLGKRVSLVEITRWLRAA